MKLRQVTIRLHPSEVKELQKMARQRERKSLERVYWTELIREMVREHLERGQDGRT